VEYEVFLNGNLFGATEATRLNIPPAGDLFQSVQVRAVPVSSSSSSSSSFYDQRAGFLSQPATADGGQSVVLQMDQFAEVQTEIDIVDYGGEGAVRTAIEGDAAGAENERIPLRVSVEEAGKYWMSFRYSNGVGPVNTLNMCAVRSLLQEGTAAAAAAGGADSVELSASEVGVFVFPQRGTGEWSNWGQSNALLVHLREGDNALALSYESHNRNMNAEYINVALLDALHLQRADSNDDDISEEEHSKDSNNVVLAASTATAAGAVGGLPDPDVKNSSLLA
jgi:hypothetical protein